jgi:hypothetical protein
VSLWQKQAPAFPIEAEKERQMNDWRSKPRTGKSQVVPLAQQIQARIGMGATIKQVYEELVSEDSITLGYRQFVRYVHELTGSTLPIKVPEKAQAYSQTKDSADLASPQAAPQNPPEKPLSNGEPVKAQERRKPMTPADFRKIREDFDKMDLDALVSGRGIVFHEK